MGPFVVPRTMGSTASMTLAVPFKIKGTNYTMSSACATSGHCIGNSMELIQMGKQDIGTQVVVENSLGDDGNV